MQFNDSTQSRSAYKDLRIASNVFRCFLPVSSITQASIMSLCTSSPHDGTLIASNAVLSIASASLLLFFLRALALPD
jgi:hypothetical protein